MATEIREAFNGALVLSAADVGKVLGLRNKEAIRNWLSTLVPRERNGRRVWLVSDVAHKLYTGEETKAG